MIEGVLNLKGMKVSNLLKPIQDTFVLSDDIILNKQEILNIYLSGYSRIPIYTNNTPLTNDNNSRIVDKTLSTMPLQQPIIIHPSLSILKLINIFIDSQQCQKKDKKNKALNGGHLAIVCNYPHLAIRALDDGLPIPNDAEVLGIVALEDVIEQLIQEEILDEKDFREQHVISH